MPKPFDPPGKPFGRWVVLGLGIRRQERSKTVVMWRCRCECGTEADVSPHNLRSGASSSCGCLRIELQTLHEGWRSHPHEYRAWRGMRSRCMVETHAQYSDYGGRGIGICARWGEFALFMADMGPRPSPKHSIDRVDNSGDYSPENCRWTTSATQNQNRRSTKLTMEDARRIRALKGNMKQAEIARMFNVSIPTVCLVQKERIWREGVAP